MEGPTQGVADMVEAFRSARTRVSAGRAADGTAVVVKTPAGLRTYEILDVTFEH